MFVEKIEVLTPADFVFELKRGLRKKGSNLHSESHSYG
ncbi:hypothetical protein DSBG_0318 [Desulfosporosinus sp. BG]|nr:hypothetical protein DSBG_0318 [Desulfosporosinus sp. BG]